MEQLTNDLKNSSIKDDIKTSNIKYASGYTQTVRTNANGNLSGDQELYDAKGKIVSFDQYKDGRQHGYCRKYVNDVKVYENIYTDGKLHGTCQEWDINGNLLSTIDYENGLKHGKSIIYLKYHRQIRYTEYKNGRKDGHDIAVEDDVNVMEMTYKDGIPYGQCIKRHPNGKTMSTINYVNGQMEGEAIEYDDQGQVISKMMIRNGRFVGI